MSQNNIRDFQAQQQTRRAIPIYMGGSMQATAHPQTMGNRGSAYRYGETIVGGTINMVQDGDRLISAIYPTNGQIFGWGSLVSQNFRFMLGVVPGGTDVSLRSSHIEFISTQFESGASTTMLNASGEMIYQDTSNLGAGGIGAISETFASAGTITATNSSGAILGAGTAFTTAALNSGYAYTPSLNAPRPGDIIEIVQGANHFYHRIRVITDATHMTVDPNFPGSTAGGLAYTLRRTGYGSYSRLVRIQDSTSGSIYGYYAGNVRHNVITPGTIEGISISGVGLGNHYSGPQTSGVAADIKALDLAYYKSFMLYGFGAAVGWSVAGFPTAFPFGTTDFPALNVTVVDNTDQFISFEYIGDQLIAIFRNGIWLVQPTGTVPEFNFYRLPEIVGANLGGTTDGYGIATTFSYARPTVTARQSVFYMTKEGLAQLKGQTMDLIDAEINAAHLIGDAGAPVRLSWDSSTDTVIATTAGTTEALLYRVPYKSFSRLVPTTLSPSTARGFAGNIQQYSGIQTQPRHFSIGYGDGILCFVGYDAATQSVANDRAFDALPSVGDANNVASTWSYSSPVIDLGAYYADFKMGGFTIDCFGVSGAAPSLTWTQYGGSSPYNMQVIKTGTLAYAKGSTNARQLLGQKSDMAYVAITLTGNSWIDGYAIWLYDAQSKAATR